VQLSLPLSSTTSPRIWCDGGSVKLPCWRFKGTASYQPLDVKTALTKCRELHIGAAKVCKVLHML
jgi:hypothetical protein